MLLGGLMLGIIKYPVNKVILINSMYLLLGACLTVSGLLSPSGYVYFVILIALSGVSGAVYNACFNTVLQETIQTGMFGQVFSLYISVCMLPSLIGLVGIRFFADTIVLAQTFVLLGAIIFVLGIISFSVPSIMALGKEITEGKV